MEYKGFKYTVRVCPDTIYTSIDRESDALRRLPLKVSQEGWFIPAVSTDRSLLKLEHISAMPQKGASVSEVLDNIHRQMDEALNAWEYQGEMPLTAAAEKVHKANEHLTCSYGDGLVKWLPLTFEALDNPVGYSWVPDDAGTSGTLYRNPVPFR